MVMSLNLFLTTTLTNLSGLYIKGIADFLSIVSVYSASSVHIYVLHASQWLYTTM
jgi:hypothetical protein